MDLDKLEIVCENVDVANIHPINSQIQLNQETSNKFLITGRHPKDICKFYQNNCWCKFGKHCRYSHNCLTYKDGNTMTNLQVEQVDTMDLLSINNENKTNPIPLDNSLNTKDSNKVANKFIKDNHCIFFMSGYCRHGRHCRYIHDKEHRSVVRNKLKIETNFKKVHPDFENTKDLKTSKNPKIKEKLISTDYNSTPVIKSSRSIEIEQFFKRYPDTIRTELNESTVLQFIFSPTDPDWPFLVKQINIKFTLPLDYPEKKLEFYLIEDEIMPEFLIKFIEDEGLKWIDEEHIKTGGDLLIRPMLKWLDKNLESLFIQGLTKLKMERQAKAAGLEFISSLQLKKKYTNSVEPSKSSQLSINHINNDSLDISTLELEKENIDTSREINGNTCLSNNIRKGTELSFKDFEFSCDTIGTISVEVVGLILSCGRCSRKFDVKIQNLNIENLICTYCKQVMQCKLNSSLIHAQSHILGYIDALECNVVDCVLPDCQFIISCLNCNYGTTMTSLMAGQVSNTWCRSCHKKFVVLANNIKILKLTSSTILRLSGEKKEVGIKKIKAIKDAAIQEGQPLPDFGVCRHFKKSFRWFRFPCCGKAYPCDLCHNKNEDHEMKMANRMICGFCAHEQSYSNDKPCSRCHHHMTNKPTSHWEGGTGCRDVIKMSRNDAKKYKGSSHSKAAESNTKNTKLRHHS